MPSAGEVNRTQLESYYQSPGQTYDDAMTEGAFNLLADQMDANWIAYMAFRQGYTALVDGGGFTDPFDPTAPLVDGGSF